MKAAVMVEDRKMTVTEVDVPEPAEGQVRIKVDLAGICGSDNSLFNGKFHVPFPVIGGHEAVGRVEKLGPGVKTWTVGQRVTIHPNYYCGECQPCQDGFTNICKKKVRLGIDAAGVFAEYVVVPAKQIYQIPDDLPDEKAVFAEPLSVIVHAMGLVPPQKNDNVLIFGAGVMGLIALQMAVQKQARVTACDLEEKRIAMAKKMGAADTIGPSQSLESFADQFNLIFETSGASAALSKAIRLAAPRGKIVVLGLSSIEHPMASEMIVRKELTITGSMIYTDEFPKAIELLRQNKIDTKALTSKRVSLEGLNQALTDFSSPDRIKTLVDIR